MTNIDKVYNLMTTICKNYTVPGKPRKEAEEKMREVDLVLKKIAVDLAFCNCNKAKENKQ